MQGEGACMQAPYLLGFLSTHRLWLVGERGAAGRERPCQVGVGSRDTLRKPGTPVNRQTPAWGSTARRSLEVVTQHHVCALGLTGLLPLPS